jgi:hypothetical protein
MLTACCQLAVGFVMTNDYRSGIEALITTILFSKQWSISFANCLKACPPENDYLKTEPSLPASVVIQVQHKLVVSGEVSLNSTPVSSPNSVIHHT